MDDAARIFYPKKLVFSKPGDAGSSDELLWERRTEQMFAFSFNSMRRSKPGTPSKTRPRSLTSTLSSDEQRSAAAATATLPFIEDLVALPESMDLFIVRHGFSVYERISACSYGGDLKSGPRMVDFLADRRLAVTCTRPPELRMHKTLQVENVSLELDNGIYAPLLPHADRGLKPVRWDEALVYAVQVTDVDVIVYVKHVFDAARRKATEYTELENFRCSFGEAVETPVTAGAQEVFRCEIPRVNHPTTFASRVKVHLLYKGKSIPSVAYYEPIRGESTLPAKIADAGGDLEVDPSNLGGALKMPPKKKYLVCSCTMVWNVAKFLKEWVLFNSDLGVEKFFLYDNNSEDHIMREVSGLSNYNVTRRSWPWVKTQEAGFSHCAVEAQRECTWVLFTDVDEYLFPKRWLSEYHAMDTRTDRSPLASLIADTLTRVTLPALGSSSVDTLDSVKPAPPLEVGQISFMCRNFGPSGLFTSPSDGVTQGYTCRDQREQRHKSIVYYPALKPSLQNVIHHFHLKPNYQTVNLDARLAVVNHYKFQAWREFETKFTKRASTYVVDWKEHKSLNSKDRPDGVGPDAMKPPDWEMSHCETNDTDLRDYTRRRFGVHGSGDTLKMAWEL